MQTRKSSRDFSEEGLSLEDLSYFLKYSCGEFSPEPSSQAKPRRVYPSGGARYSTEAYVILRRSNDERISPGVYHYNVKQDTLEYLWEEKESSQDPMLLVRDEWATRASALIVLTSVFWRGQNKYGDRGYRYQCIEVGAIIQNLYLNSYARGLSCVAYGGTNDDQIESLLRLDSDTESLISTVIIGKPARS